MITNEKMITIASLSKFIINDEELKKFKLDIENIINVLDRLSVIITKDIEPIFNTSISTYSLREDEVLKSNKNILKLSSYVEEDVLIIPKVL